MKHLSIKSPYRSSPVSTHLRTINKSSLESEFYQSEISFSFIKLSSLYAYFVSQFIYLVNQN